MRKTLTSLLLTLMIAAGLSGCVNTTRSAQSEWPQSLPPKDYFVNYYLEDEANQEDCTLDEYLTWVERFYFGWEFYRRGWLQATNELVESVDEPSIRQDVRHTSLLIGKLVSSEWAKAGKHRAIDTGHLSVWGNAIVKSIEQQEQLATLNHILSDINQLLAGELRPRDISEGRYFKSVAFDSREF